jgi:glycine/serine hydroxymethyltransferase
MDLIASLMTRVLAAPDDESVALAVRAEVEALCRTFPLYPHLSS